MGGTLRLLVAGVAALALTGCRSLVTRNVAVNKTVLAPHVLDATLEQLNSQLAAQYAAVNTLNAKVSIKVATGGQREGAVQEVIPTFNGYMLLRKPADLRVILQLPVVGSLALDMVSDGNTFKLVVPAKKIAREGSEEIHTKSEKGFENLRPRVIRDALLVPAAKTDEFVNLTQNARILPPESGKKVSTEEPDYDLTISRAKSGNVLETVRVIHIGRVTLRPYEQDIYDSDGKLVEVVTYNNYQKFGDVEYPTSILITMPIYEYSLKIDITKLALNQEMDDEQFKLTFPPDMPVTRM